jgi:membrane fusion protein (multidrug efflux system)
LANITEQQSLSNQKTTKGNPLRAYATVIFITLIIFGSIGAYVYRQISAMSEMNFTPPPVTVGAAIAKPEIWSSTLSAVGTIRAARGVELSSEESGEVIAVNVKSGASVAAGDLLISLNNRVELASRKRQIANLDLAKLLFDRDRKLAAQKSIPQTQYDRSKADLESAIAQLAETEARLDNKAIHAPFAGTIGIIHVRVGDYVKPGGRITTLQDLSELEVDFTVPERHFPVLKPGLKIIIKSSATLGRETHAVLQAVDSRVEADTRNLLLRGALNETSGLLPGMFAELSIDLDNPTSLVTVPETAINYSLSGDTVYVIEESSEGLSVTPRIVKTGDSRAGRTAILEGITDGERVVTAGQNKLYRRATVVVDDSVTF